MRIDEDDGEPLPVSIDTLDLKRSQENVSKLCPNGMRGLPVKPQRQSAITRIVDLRNGQEHVTTTKGRPLITKNFELLPTNKVHVPAWYLDGDVPRSIAEQMPRMVDQLLQFAETMFVACISANLPVFPPMILQVNEKPDPLCPISYTLIIDASRFTFSQPAAPQPDSPDSAGGQ
jgi:hypothetical protein